MRRNDVLQDIFTLFCRGTGQFGKTCRSDNKDSLREQAISEALPFNVTLSFDTVYFPHQTGFSGHLSDAQSVPGIFKQIFHRGSIHENTVYAKRWFL